MKKFTESHGTITGFNAVAIYRSGNALGPGKARA
jgi:hypothetical protein